MVKANKYNPFFPTVGEIIAAVLGTSSRREFRVDKLPNITDRKLLEDYKKEMLSFTENQNDIKATLVKQLENFIPEYISFIKSYKKTFYLIKEKTYLIGYQIILSHSLKN